MAAKKKEYDPKKAYNVKNKTTGQTHQVMGHHFSLKDPNYQVLGEFKAPAAPKDPPSGDNS